MTEPGIPPTVTPNYHIIITGVAQSNFAQGVSALAQHFLLEPLVAEQILKSYPVVFLSEVGRDEYKAIKSRLLEVSKSGVEFSVTTKTPVTVPCVSWLTRPRYSEAGGNLIKYVEFQWRGNAFVCPNCGETFLFQRIGNPLARFIKPKEEKPAVSAVPPAVSSAEPRVVPPPPPARVTQPEEKPKSAPVESKPRPLASAPRPATEEVQPVEVEIEEVTPEEKKPAPPAPKRAESAAPARKPIQVDPPPAATLPESEKGVVELKPLGIGEIPDEGLPEAVDILGESAPDTITAKETAVPAPESPAEANSHNLFLSQIASADKKEAAAKIITEIKGISLQESRRLVDRMLIPVLKEVSETEAKTALERFKKSGISGKITKVTHSKSWGQDLHP